MAIAELMYVEVDGLQFFLRLCYTDLGRFMNSGMKIKIWPGFTNLRISNVSLHLPWLL